jgi:hypothetical protein
LKVCNNEKCEVYNIDRHFARVFRFCPFCASPLVEKNKREKPMNPVASITNGDMEYAFKRLWRTMEEKQALE